MDQNNRHKQLVIHVLLNFNHDDRLKKNNWTNFEVLTAPFSSFVTYFENFVRYIRY